MSVEHAVELALDARATGIVEVLMDRLDAAGIPSLRSLAPHVHPHVSLAVASGRPADVAAACRGLGAALPELTLSGLGAFLAPARVAYLAVTATEPLLALNREVHARLDAAGVACRELYRPGRWVPHVTLAMHVASVGAALGLVEDVELPVRAAPVHLGVVEVPTGKLVAVVE